MIEPMKKVSIVLLNKEKEEALKAVSFSPAPSIFSR